MGQQDQVRQTVSDSYARAVTSEEGCCSGSPVQKGVAAKLAGYTREELEALPPEAVMRMAIELSRFPRHVVNCLGQVVRCDPHPALDGGPPKEFLIGVHFTLINAEDRERIIRHVFRMQRQLLRNRKDRE